jgi:hypothetical protein
VLADLAMLALGADDLRRAAELAELALVEAGTDAAATARALEVASVADMNLARPGRAESRANEALARYTELGDSRGAARILDPGRWPRSSSRTFAPGPSCSTGPRTCSKTRAT